MAQKYAQLQDESGRRDSVHLEEIESSVGRQSVPIDLERKAKNKNNDEEHDTIDKHAELRLSGIDLTLDSNRLSRKRRSAGA